MTTATTYRTIRKNSLKQIRSLLESAVLIREFRYDDMGDTLGPCDTAKVLALAEDFDRVYAYGGTLHVIIHRNWSFTAYQTIEDARRDLTPHAFARYFPAVS